MAATPAWILLHEVSLPWQLPVAVHLVSGAWQSTPSLDTYSSALSTGALRALHICRCELQRGRCVVQQAQRIELGQPNSSEICLTGPCMAGLHMVQEADCESRAPSPIAVQAAAGPYPQPLSQVRRLPSDEHHLVSQDSAGVQPQSH